MCTVIYRWKQRQCFSLSTSDRYQPTDIKNYLFSPLGKLGVRAIYFAIYICFLYFLACSAKLPKGLYNLPIFVLNFLACLANCKGYIFCHFFFILLFSFTGRLCRSSSSEPNGLIFTKISGLVDGCNGLFISFSFIQFLKGRCHGNQLKSKNRCFSRTNLLCRTAIRKRIAISQFQFQKVQ